MGNYSVYWSPTGGTRKVAQAVEAGWGEPFSPVDLMKPPVRTRFLPGDLCLVAVPSYGGRVPEPVVRSLDGFQGNGAAAVLIAVFGNRAIDDTLLELSDVLSRAGFRCIAAMEAVAQHSLLPRFGAGRPDGEDQAQLGDFARRIRSVAEDFGTKPVPELPGNRPYRTYKGVPLKPSVGSGCIGCGICADQCPVGAIPRMNCRITDTRKCISCMHCVAVCPKHARKLNGLMTFAAAQGMKKTCSERKPNRLYL